MIWNDRRFWLHVPVGIVGALLYVVGGWLCWCFTFTFFVYEVNEDRHLKDRAFIDIQGFLAGLAIGGLLIWLHGVIL